MRIKLLGLSEVVSRLPQIPEEIERTVMLRLSQVAFDSAQIGADRHNRTGALRQSLFNQATESGGRAVGHDLQQAPHAEWVLLGSRPHVIVPNKKKSLRWAAGGNFFFAKKVNHPGYRGDGYLIQAASDALRQFNTIVDDATKEAAK